MSGTASPLPRVLLVHQPGPWGPRGLLESRCDPDVAHRIDVAAANAGMRLQTIRRPGKHETGAPAGGYDVGIADTRPGKQSITWWRTDDLADMAAELEAGWPRRAPFAIETAPLYLVCAHGRHDACCALRGRPVARAFEGVRPGRAWETTHLGGDRFAANLLILPAGLLYGRVTAEAATAIADRIDAGDVVPEFMRGRIGLSPIAQAALIFAHERLGIVASDALAVASVRRVDPGRALVTVKTPRGAVVVTVVIEMGSPAQLTCRGPEGATARAYRGTDIRDADADAI
jgi:hypothetical protein